MDSDSLAELDQFAKDHDIQIIGTRVTTDPDDCTLIIKNGYIEGMENHMAEIPVVVRKGKNKETSDGEPVKVETVDSKAEEKPDEPAVSAAYEGKETDAMKRAKELLARKRKQILDSQATLNFEG